MVGAKDKRHRVDQKDAVPIRWRLFSGFDRLRRSRLGGNFAGKNRAFASRRQQVSLAAESIQQSALSTQHSARAAIDTWHLAFGALDLWYCAQKSRYRSEYCELGSALIRKDQMLSANC
jgi:hypothetical protein